MDNGQKRFARCLLMVVLFTLFLLNGCGLDTNQNNSSETPERQSSQAAFSAQQIPSTPIRPVAGPAVLGGQIGAFVKKFGDPNSHSDPSFDSYSFRRYNASNVDYLRVVGDAVDALRVSNRSQRAASPTLGLYVGGGHL